jgi:hypothetical protein
MSSLWSAFVRPWSFTKGLARSGGWQLHLSLECGLLFGAFFQAKIRPFQSLLSRCLLGVLFLFPIRIDLVSPAFSVNDVDVNGNRRDDEEHSGNGAEPADTYFLHGRQYHGSPECPEEISDHVIPS